MKVLSAAEEDPFFNCLLASFHLLGFLFAFGANSEASTQASSTSKINADLKSRLVHTEYKSFLFQLLPHFF